jgi:hypothetical protein
MVFNWLGSMFVIFWFVFVVRMCWVYCVKMVQGVEDTEVFADLEAFRVSRPEGQAQQEQEQEPKADRKEQIRAALYFQKLEEDCDCRSLPNVVERAKEMFHNTSSEEGRTYLSRSWRAAESSLRIFAQQECSICLENYKGGETICLPKTEDCIHVFHEDCISVWLTNRNDCPLCRTDLMKGYVEKIEEKEELPV